MNLSEIQASMQQQLGSVGVPVNQARSAAQILAEENTAAITKQPIPKRTPERQHIVSSAYEWMKAKAE